MCRKPRKSKAFCDSADGTQSVPATFPKVTGEMYDRRSFYRKTECQKSRKARLLRAAGLGLTLNRDGHHQSSDNDRRFLAGQLHHEILQTSRHFIAVWRKSRLNHRVRVKLATAILNEGVVVRVGR